MRNSRGPARPSRIGRSRLGALRRPTERLLATVVLMSLLSGEASSTGIADVCGRCRVETVAQCGTLLEAPAFDRSGGLWLAAPTKAAIYRVGSDGSCAPAIAMPLPDGIPAGMRFRPDGTILGVDAAHGFFVADPKDRSASYVGARPVVGHFPGAGFHGLDDLVLDAEGGAYVTDALGSSVLNPVGSLYYRSGDGKIVLLHRGGLAFPDGIALSPDGRTLYVGEWRAARILKIPVIGPGAIDVEQADVFAQLPNGTGPDGLAVGPEGNLFVADWGGGGQITVYRPDGRSLGGIRFPGEETFEPTNLAFAGDWLYFTDTKGVVRRVRTEGRAATSSERGDRRDPPR